MKKIEFLLLSIFGVFVISCNSSNSNHSLIKEIEYEVEMANSQCPIFVALVNNQVLERVTFGDKR